MHSLLICSIFMVPSQRKYVFIYKTFVEIFLSHAHYIQSYIRIILKCGKQAIQ